MGSSESILRNKYHAKETGVALRIVFSPCVRAIVHDLLKNGSRPVKLQTLTVLWDRIFGKPKQEIGVSGGLVHAHTRDPRLAAMPKDALEALAKAYDDVLAKLSLARPECRAGCPAKSSRIKADHPRGTGAVRGLAGLKMASLVVHP